MNGPAGIGSSLPLVSVVVPSYNAAPFVGELCRSLQAQTLTHLEMLIGDDGSTDNTTEALAPFRSDPRFRFFGWQPNRGVAHATQFLLSQVRGEFWCHPGADDVLLPDFIERRVRRLIDHPEAVLVHGPPIVMDEQGATQPTPPGPRLPGRLESPRSLAILLQHNLICAPSVMVRTRLTRDILPRFNTAWRYAQDWHLWLLHAATGFEVLRDDEPLVRYRVHAGSLTMDPARVAVRAAEIRLVPLCTLATTAGFSAPAAEMWQRWRAPLYHLWLRRALKLRRAGQLNPKWQEMAAAAFHGTSTGASSPPMEILRALPGFLRTCVREQRALRRQTFRVAGFPLVDDPMFRDGSPG